MVGGEEKSQDFVLANPRGAKPKPVREVSPSASPGPPPFWASTAFCGSELVREGSEEARENRLTRPHNKTWTRFLALCKPCCGATKHATSCANMPGMTKKQARLQE